MTAATRRENDNGFSPTLFVAFELGDGKWKIGSTPGLGQKAREYTVSARDCRAVLQEIERAILAAPIPGCAWDREPCRGLLEY
jgi:hypothetical protein